MLLPLTEGGDIGNLCEGTQIYQTVNSHAPPLKHNAALGDPLVLMGVISRIFSAYCTMRFA